MDQGRSTKWPQLGDPTLYLDVTITKAKYSYQNKQEKYEPKRMEKYYEKHAMGLADSEEEITIENLLLDGKEKVTLIEGDPGCGKTTLTLHICRKWTSSELLAEDLLLLIPLRSYELATNATDLFELLNRLGCPLPGMKEYAQQNYGKGIVLILDGWDELPSQLRSSSLFSDIVFRKNHVFLNSTIIVTSRPSCSQNIAKVVQQRKAHYQILGFSPHNSELFIKHYFDKDLRSADLLIAMLKGQEHLCRHFYIPITVAIMCFVYSHSENGQIPETLSKLYERFVLLYVYFNVPDACRQEFNTLYDILTTLKPIFGKLCKTAYDMLRDDKLVFDEEVLGITNNDLKSLNLDSKQFDGFGLLHVEYFPTKLATMKRFYSFIHRAVQELLAAIFVMDTGNIIDVLDDHFYEDSFLMNMFPFLLGLVSKEVLRSLAEKLIQVFIKAGESNCLFLYILHCLFETHDDTLCREFGQVFIEDTTISLSTHTLLEYRCVCYFIGACGIQRLNVNIWCFDFSSSNPCDLYAEILCKYLQNTLTDIESFHNTFRYLSHKGIEQFAKAISFQNNIRSVKLKVTCKPGSVKILCDSICKHNPKIINLVLPEGDFSKDDLKSIGYLLITCLSLERLHMNCPWPPAIDVGMQLDVSMIFCKALCNTKSLKKLVLKFYCWSSFFISTKAHLHARILPNFKVLGNIINQNCSLKELHINVATADYLDPILNGLSYNTSITIFRGWPNKVSNSSTLGQCLKQCLTDNHLLNIVDFTNITIEHLYVSWSSIQVVSICTGLCANTTVVTLDISGCCIDTEAYHAVCEILSRNTILQHLFLNPVQLKKQEAIAIIDSCRVNATLELLSLVHWPPKRSFSHDDDDDDDGQNPFSYLCDPEINQVLQKIHSLREEKNEPHLRVCWLVAIAKAIYVLLSIFSIYRKYGEYKEVKEQILPSVW